MADYFDVNIEAWTVDILTAVMDDLVSSSPSLSHHTGVTAGVLGHETELVLAEGATIMLPGFDMKTEGQPVGPNGQMRGNLLGGPATRTSKSGSRYNIIPLNPDVTPGQFHAPTADNQDLYISANMLAQKAGVQAAMQFLQGAGLTSDEVYRWSTERYAGVSGTAGSRVVFRTVSTDSPAASWWYPPRMVSDPTSIAEALADIESWLKGAGG